ncbi:MAG: hypothetical protein ACJ0BW_00030 [Pontiellaceae bacterium]
MKKNDISIQGLLDYGSKKLSLSIVSGEDNLDHKIIERLGRFQRDIEDV